MEMGLLSRSFARQWVALVSATVTVSAIVPSFPAVISTPLQRHLFGVVRPVSLGGDSLFAAMVANRNLWLASHLSMSLCLDILDKVCGYLAFFVSSAAEADGA